MNSVEEGEISSVDEFKTVCSKLADPQMKFCPGLSPEEYAQYKDVIRYDKKGVQIIDHPLRYISSTKCKLWFPLPLHGTSMEKIFK